MLDVLNGEMKTISFVIPLYNEEERIGKTFKALSGVRLPVGLKLENVIFVNDGSKDNTLKLIKEFKGSSKLGRKIKIVTYSINKGKGYAIKSGMLASNADYTLFFDADMSTPLSELTKFMPFIKEGVNVIVGTRKNGHSTVIKHQPKLREFLGKGFTLMTKTALSLQVTDFTCGFKAFDKASKDKVFESSQIEGWGYDAEILFLANKYGFCMVEKAVIWSNDERTKVKLYKAVPQTLGEIAKIRWMHSIKPALSPRAAFQPELSKPIQA